MLIYQISEGFLKEIQKGYWYFIKNQCKQYQRWESNKKIK